MSERAYNFAAGPAMMPLPVLEQIQKDLPVFENTGMSVMEMTHRGKDFEDIFANTKALLRELMEIPEDYAVLFLPGGATAQFASVPLNMPRSGAGADYIDSGNFAHGAAEEAKKYGPVRVIASSREENYTRIPDWTGKMNPDADYLHITTNNTIFGTHYSVLPEPAANVPLVADMSSNILGEWYDVKKFGVIYAGMQKNIGPAGACVLIARRDLLGHAGQFCPKVLDWTQQDKADSLLNTPCTFALYAAGLCLEWLREQGGVREIEKVNREKAALLYDFLDNSALFKAPARREDRSVMNVTFVTGDPDTDAEFVKFAAARNLRNVKGHRLVGGMRASIYNAMPLAGVRALRDAMADFEAKKK